MQAIRRASSSCSLSNGQGGPIQSPPANLARQTQRSFLQENGLRNLVPKEAKSSNNLFLLFWLRTPCWFLSDTTEPCTICPPQTAGKNSKLACPSGYAQDMRGGSRKLEINCHTGPKQLGNGNPSVSQRAKDLERASVQGKSNGRWKSSMNKSLYKEKCFFFQYIRTTPIRKICHPILQKREKLL